jgi:hypothetical protein
MDADTVFRLAEVDRDLAERAKTVYHLLVDVPALRRAAMGLYALEHLTGSAVHKHSARELGEASGVIISQAGHIQRELEHAGANGLAEWFEAALTSLESRP